MISNKLELLLNIAIRTANEYKHEFLTLENVLLALLTDDVVCKVITECGAGIDSLAKEVEEFVADNNNFSILTDEEIKELGDEQFANEDMKKLANESGIYYQPEISLSLQRIIQRAALHVQASGKKTILPIQFIN